MNNVYQRQYKQRETSHNEGLCLWYILGTKSINPLNIKYIEYKNFNPFPYFRYSEVSLKALEQIKVAKAETYLNLEATPTFFWACQVPYGLHHELEVEVERLENVGVIKPVHFSEWPVPIVATLKRVPIVRNCGDEMFTANQTAHIDQMPFQG